jgi:hypothetical protein
MSGETLSIVMNPTALICRPLTGLESELHFATWAGLNVRARDLLHRLGARLSAVAVGISIIK